MGLRITILFCLLLSGASLLAAENIKIFKAGVWDFSYDGQFYRTESNHSQLTNREGLPSGNFYELIDTTLGTRFVYSDYLAFYGSGNYALARSQGSSGERSTPLFNRMNFGCELKAFEGSFNIIPDISFTYPLEKLNTEMSDVMTSEGVNELIGKVYFQKQYGALFAFSYLGLNYRSGGRSHLAPWGIGGDWYLGTTIFGGELYGFHSITHDIDSGDLNAMKARDVARARVAGSSEKFYSIDPSMIGVQFYMKFQPSSRLQFKIGGGTSLFGDRYASGYHVLMGAVYRFDFGSWYVEKTEKKNSSYIDTPYSSDSALPYFEEDTDDGVDQGLFYPSSKSPLKKKTRSSDKNLKESDEKSSQNQKVEPSEEIQIKLKRSKKR